MQPILIKALYGKLIATVKTLSCRFCRKMLYRYNHHPSMMHWYPGVMLEIEIGLLAVKDFIDLLIDPPH